MGRLQLPPGMHRAGARAAFALAVIGVTLIGLWPSVAPGPGPGPAGALLLDQRAPLRADGTEFAFTVRRPSRVRIQVRLPAGMRARVRFGVPAGADPRDIAYAPLAAREAHFEVAGETSPPLERDLMAVGIYILRVEPLGMHAAHRHAEARAIVSAWPILPQHAR